MSDSHTLLPRSNEPDVIFDPTVSTHKAASLERAIHPPPPPFVFAIDERPYVFVRACRKALPHHRCTHHTLAPAPQCRDESATREALDKRARVRAAVGAGEPLPSVAPPRPRKQRIFARFESECLEYESFLEVQRKLAPWHTPAARMFGVQRAAGGGGPSGKFGELSFEHYQRERHPRYQRRRIHSSRALA